MHRAHPRAQARAALPLPDQAARRHLARVRAPKPERLYRFQIKRHVVTSPASERLASQVFTPGDVAVVLRPVFDEVASDREAFIAMALDARSRAIGFEVIAIGTLTGVEVHPREVFKAAILASAAAVIVSHNHPSGDPTPSEADLVLTKRLMDAGTVLGIPVVDHVVIGGPGRHVSIADFLGGRGAS